MGSGETFSSDGYDRYLTVMNEFVMNRKLILQNFLEHLAVCILFFIFVVLKFTILIKLSILVLLYTKNYEMIIISILFFFLNLGPTNVYTIDHIKHCKT